MKLPHMCRVIEEVAGVGRRAIKLFTNVTILFEYYIHTHFDFSYEFYGGHYDPFGGLGQGIILSGSNKRDESYVILKH